MSQEENQEVVKDVNTSNKSKETKKVEAAYDKAISGLALVFQGEDNIKPTTKVDSSKVPSLMQEMYADEQKELGDKFKEGAKALMMAKHKYGIFLKQQEEEMQKVKNGKMKEFTTAANKLLVLIDKIKDLPQYYANVLNMGGEPIVKEE